MTRRLNWEAHKQRRAEILELMVREGLQRRLPRTRPRTPDEERVLVALSVQKIRRAQAEGRWVQIAPRRWRLRFR